MMRGCTDAEYRAHLLEREAEAPGDVERHFLGQLSRESIMEMLKQARECYRRNRGISEHFDREMEIRIRSFERRLESI